MAPATSITKGNVVAFNENGELVVAPADEKDPIGVAAETRTSKADESPHLAFVKHGIAQVRATTLVKAGEAVRVGATAGEVTKLEDQAVDEGGVDVYTIHRNHKLGQALEDIAAGAHGDVFVGGA